MYECARCGDKMNEKFAKTHEKICQQIDDTIEKLLSEETRRGEGRQ